MFKWIQNFKRFTQQFFVLFTLYLHLTSNLIIFKKLDHIIYILLIRQSHSLLEITRTDYKQFLQSHPEVEIGGTKIKLHPKRTISKFAPAAFTPETNGLELPRQGQLGDAYRELQGQLVALHTPQPHPLINPSKKDEYLWVYQTALYRGLRPCA